MKISLIIPVYNVEKYLDKCLNSILCQDYDFFEAIIIDDGSTDNSKDIYNKYVKNDKRFKVIVQKNSGVSAARNAGINIATGDLIMFLDSDDYLNNEVLKKVANEFKKTRYLDFLCYGYYLLYKNHFESIVINHDMNDKEIILDNILISNKIGGYLWNKVFLRKKIIENNIKFDEKIHYCEDLVFVNEYFKHTDKPKYLPECLYYYRMRRSSVTFNFEDKKNLSILLSYEYLANIFSDNKKYFENFEYNYLLNYYRLKPILNKTDIRVNFDIVSDEGKILANHNFKEKIRFKFIKYFPKIYSKITINKNKKVDLFD